MVLHAVFGFDPIFCGFRLFFYGFTVSIKLNTHPPPNYNYLTLRLDDFCPVLPHVLYCKIDYFSYKASWTFEKRNF